MSALTTILGAWLQIHGGHGTVGGGPAFYEYLLVGVAVVVTAWALIVAVRVSVRPGEDNPKHIKRMILEDEDNGSNG